MGDDFNLMTEDEIKGYEKEVEEEFEAEAERLHIEKEELKNHDTYAQYVGDDRVISSYQLQKYYDRLGFKPERFYCGMPNLDYITGGWEESEVCVVSGVTGNGKTLFCKTLTRYFPLAGHDCLWFTYEEIPRLFISRFQELPIFYLPKKNLSHKLEWIEKRIIESKVKYKTKIVFIDHLHFLVPLKAYINQSILIGSIMREIKKIAIRHRIIIFVVAHTAKIKQDEHPDLANIRDSSFIAQESDKVFYIRRCGESENGEIRFNEKTNVYILKNRLNGNVNTLKMRFNFHTKLLDEEVNI